MKKIVVVDDEFKRLEAAYKLFQSKKLPSIETPYVNVFSGTHQVFVLVRSNWEAELNLHLSREVRDARSENGREFCGISRVLNPRADDPAADLRSIAGDADILVLDALYEWSSTDPEDQSLAESANREGHWEKLKVKGLWKLEHIARALKEAGPYNPRVRMIAWTKSQSGVSDVNDRLAHGEEPHFAAAAVKDQDQELPLGCAVANQLAFLSGTQGGTQLVIPSDVHKHVRCGDREVPLPELERFLLTHLAKLRVKTGISDIKAASSNWYDVALDYANSDEDRNGILEDIIESHAGRIIAARRRVLKVGSQEYAVAMEATKDRIRLEVLYKWLVEQPGRGTQSTSLAEINVPTRQEKIREGLEPGHFNHGVGELNRKVGRPLGVEKLIGHCMADGAPLSGGKKGARIYLNLDPVRIRLEEEGSRT